ncbi:hypothetical protein Hanom_Chr09g00863071 [Helianthus anomalus]
MPHVSQCNVSGAFYVTTLPIIQCSSGGQLCGHPRSNISHFKDSCEWCTSTTQHLLNKLKFKKIMMNCLISLMKLMSPMRYPK